MPIDHNKTSRIARAENTADWQKNRREAATSRLPGEQPGDRRKTAVRRNIRREAATSRMSGEQPDDMRNSQRRHSAKLVAAVGAMIVR